MKLSYAELRQVCGSCAELEGRVEVKNLAYAKAEFWDNNGGANYTLGWGEVIP